MRADGMLPDVISFPSGTDLHDHPLVADRRLILQVKAHEALMIAVTKLLWLVHRLAASPLAFHDASCLPHVCHSNSPCASREACPKTQLVIARVAHAGSPTKSFTHDLLDDNAEPVQLHGGGGAAPGAGDACDRLLRRAWQQDHTPGG